MLLFLNFESPFSFIFQRFLGKQTNRRKWAGNIERWKSERASFTSLALFSMRPTTMLDLSPPSSSIFFLLSLSLSPLFRFNEFVLPASFCSGRGCYSYTRLLLGTGVACAVNEVKNDTRSQFLRSVVHSFDQRNAFLPNCSAFFKFSFFNIFQYHKFTKLFIYSSSYLWRIIKQHSYELIPYYQNQTPYKTKKRSCDIRLIKIKLLRP